MTYYVYMTYMYMNTYTCTYIHILIYKYTCSIDSQFTRWGRL